MEWPSSTIEHRERDNDVVVVVDITVIFNSLVYSMNVVVRQNIATLERNSSANQSVGPIRAMVSYQQGQVTDSRLTITMTTSGQTKRRSLYIPSTVVSRSIASHKLY